MANRSRRGAVEMQEQWDPLRIGLGLLVILMVIGVIYAGILFMSAVKQERSENKDCLSYHESYANYLHALSTRDARRCAESHHPVICEAAVKRDPKACVTLDNREEQQDCLLMATRDTKYCRFSLPYCAVLLGESSGHCNSLEEFEKLSCESIASRDPTQYLGIHTKSCHNNAVERSIKDNFPGIFEKIILNFYYQFFYYDLLE